MKYTDIKDMAGLDAARKELNAKLNAKGAEVLSRWEDTKDAYSTVNLLDSYRHNTKKGWTEKTILL